MKEANVLSVLAKGTTQDEIHQVLGEPTGELSGFWGDIYSLENGTVIIVYYNEAGEVNLVKVTNKDGDEILTID